MEAFSYWQKKVERAMKLNYGFSLLLIGSLFSTNLSFAQIDSTEVEEEDYSMYDDFGYAGSESKSYANAKINGLSPARFISVGYDYQAGYDMTTGAYSTFSEQTNRTNSTQGIRIGANIPVYSTNSLIVQMGGQYWGMNYAFDELESDANPLATTLNDNGLRTLGLNTTIYKPINEKSFFLLQANADMNGDYALSSLQPMNYNRYSVAALWGKRPSDYKQWAVGLSRTYRAGELNYVPIVMYNYTSPTSKWGIEALLPARGHVRYSFTKRSILMFGFELEGNSYRIGNNESSVLNGSDLEIRRSEIRARFMYQRQLAGFIWIAAELGNRINYSYNVDEITDGVDFTRLFGIVSDAPYVMENSIGNPLYFNLSLNFVSP